jgi:hypothetical protein
MTAVDAQGTGTVFDALLASVQDAASFNREDVVPPAAILWPDEKREWSGSSLDSVWFFLTS